MLHQTLIQRRRLDIYDLVRVCDPRHDNGDSKPPVKTPRTNRCISHNKGSNELPLSRLDVSFLVKYDIYAVFYMINRQSLPFTLFQTRLKNTDSSKITWVSSHFDRVRRPLPSYDSRKNILFSVILSYSCLNQRWISLPHLGAERKDLVLLDCTEASKVRLATADPAIRRPRSMQR